MLVDLERLGVPDLAAVRVALAVSLFRSGSVSAGFAAHTAGMPLPGMLELLSSLDVPLGGSREEAVHDMASARKWLKAGS